METTKATQSKVRRSNFFRLNTPSYLRPPTSRISTNVLIKDCSGHLSSLQHAIYCENFELKLLDTLPSTSKVTPQNKPSTKKLNRHPGLNSPSDVFPSYRCQKMRELHIFCYVQLLQFFAIIGLYSSEFFHSWNMLKSKF